MFWKGLQSYDVVPMLCVWPYGINETVLEIATVSQCLSRADMCIKCVSKDVYKLLNTTGYSIV